MTKTEKMREALVELEHTYETAKMLDKDSCINYLTETGLSHGLCFYFRVKWNISIWIVTLLSNKQYLYPTAFDLFYEENYHPSDALIPRIKLVRRILIARELFQMILMCSLITLVILWLSQIGINIIKK